MFLIILDNSIKFSPLGTTVSVKMYRDKTECIISFTDHGHGIRPEDLPHIFQRFYWKQSDQNPNGSGLGLPIAKQIANRHGIKISWESVRFDHTTFFFAFSGTWQPK